MFMLLEKGDIARALQLSYESSDNSVFKAMRLKGELFACVHCSFFWGGGGGIFFFLFF